MTAVPWSDVKPPCSTGGECYTPEEKRISPIQRISSVWVYIAPKMKTSLPFRGLKIAMVY